MVRHLTDAELDAGPKAYVAIENGGERRVRAEVDELRIESDAGFHG